MLLDISVVKIDANQVFCLQQYANLEDQFILNEPNRFNLYRVHAKEEHDIDVLELSLLSFHFDVSFKDGCVVIRKKT